MEKILVMAVCGIGGGDFPPHLGLHMAAKLVEFCGCALVVLGGLASFSLGR